MTQQEAGSGNLTDQVQDQNFSRFALDGGRDMGNLILLEGSPDATSDWGGLLVSPSSDSVQEMQVIRGTYDAQFGKTGGGLVSLVPAGAAIRARHTDTCATTIWMPPPGAGASSPSAIQA
jgi:hypothetical protein